MKQKFFKVMFIAILTLMSISIGVVTFAAQPEPGIEPMWDKLLSCSYDFEKVSSNSIDVFAKTLTPPDYDAYVKIELEYYKDGKWQNYYTWEKQANFSATIEDTLTVPRGYTYQLKLTHQVRNIGTSKVVETFEQYSDNVVTILPEGM